MNFTAGRHNSYGEFLKAKFGNRIHKIPINAGFTCPNRDGTLATGGCTYCNIASFTPETARARIPISEQVNASIGYLKQRFKSSGFIAYFQPYTNTYAPVDELAALYEQALAHPDIIGLAIGTRPDCIDDTKLDYLEQLARDYFVTLEFGIESCHDNTLRQINRGHDFQCTVDGISRTVGRGIYICGHVIYGFPQETTEQMLETTDKVAQLPLDFIKIHNLHVVRHTELAAQYHCDPFHLFSFEEWTTFVCQVIERLNPNFIVERLYGDAPRNLLIAPLWCRDKSAAQVIHAVQLRLKSLDTHQGKLFTEAIEYVTEYGT